MATFYLPCTSIARGAIGIFHLYGPEEELAVLLDGRVGRGLYSEKFIPLQNNELRYGWLRSADDREVDEVMVGKTVAGMRVLMTHGGDGVYAAVCAFLEESGATVLEYGGQSVAGFLEKYDFLHRPLLAGCVTESQIAAVLEAGAGGEAGMDILVTRRMLLCGAPNVGKSSLFNALCGWERAFVYDWAGVTTDVVDELVDLGGYGVWLGDMPGFSGDDAAWGLAGERIALADVLAFVCDGSSGWTPADDAAARAVCDLVSGEAVGLVALTKGDLGCVVDGEPWREFFPSARVVRVSGLPGGNARSVFDGVAYDLLRQDPSTQSTL